VQEFQRKGWVKATRGEIEILNAAQVEMLAKST
jgi:hypothetical protein